MSQHASWNLGDVAWDSRAMVMIPAAGPDSGPAGWDAVESSHGRNTRNHGNHHGSRADQELTPRATSAATMPRAVRCAHEGCRVMFHYSMQSRVRLGSVFCPAHQPVALSKIPGGKDQPRPARGSDSGSGKSSDGKLSPEPTEPNAMSPAVTNGAAAAAAARIRGDGTARTTGLKAFLALRDSTGTWSSMACRVCGYVQNQNKNQTHAAKGGKGAAGTHALNAGVGAKSVGKVMSAVSSRSSLDCGCMRKWEVVIDGLSYRFCSGCKLYHELKYFENEKSAKKPSKVCAVFKERRRLRKLAAAHGSRDDAAGSSRLQDPIGIGSNARRGRGTARVGSPNPGSDSVSPADSVSGESRGGSLGSNDAANTGMANDKGDGANVGNFAAGVGAEAFAPSFVEDVVDRFVVDGGSNRYGEERAHKLRNCSMFTHNAGGDGFDHFLNTFINDPVGVNVGMNAGFDAAPSHGFLRNAFSTVSAKVPGHVRDVADAGGRGDLHGDFVSSMLDGAGAEQTGGGRDEGARFGYLFPGSVIVGMDAIDLPEGCAARVDPLRAMDDLLFGGKAGDSSRVGRLAALAREASARGECVAASVSGFIYRARVDPNTGVPALFPVPAPRGALEVGALHCGSYATAHLTDATIPEGGPSRAGSPLGPNSLVRVELNGDVLGGGDVALRCRFAGHYLPVRMARHDANSDRTVVEVCVAPPREGFVALEGCAFIETYVASGELRGLPCGFPVPVVLTSDPVVHAELRRALDASGFRGGDSPAGGFDDARERAAAWACVTVATALAEAGRASAELARDAAAAAASIGAARALALIMREHARVPGLVGAHLPTLRAMRESGAPVADSFDEDSSFEESDLFVLDEGDVEFVGESEFELAVASGRRRAWFADLPVTVTQPFSSFLDAGVEDARRNGARGRLDVHATATGRRRGGGWMLYFENLSWKSFDVVGVIFFTFYLRNRPEEFTAGHALMAVVCVIGMLYRAVFMSMLVANLKDKTTRLRGEEAGSVALSESIRRDIITIRLCINTALILECWLYGWLCSEVFAKFTNSIYPLSRAQMEILANGGSVFTLDFLRRWLRLVVLCLSAKALFNAKVVSQANLAEFRVPTWWNLKTQTLNHVLSPHVAFVPTILGAMHPNAAMSRGVVFSTAGFVIVDSIVTGALLLALNVLRSRLTKPGLEGLGHSVPFSFSVGPHTLVPRAKRD